MADRDWRAGRPRPTWEKTPNNSGRSFASQNWRAGPVQNSEEEEVQFRPRPNRWNQDSRPSGYSSTNENKNNTNNNNQSQKEVSSALAEGRRIYVGNLKYIARQEDVETLFVGGDYHITLIDISMDPFTARNPSYCFVELESKEEAERALRELNGLPILGRPVKLGPCVAKSVDQSRGGSRDSSSGFAFDRWARNDAQKHFRGYTETRRRLVVSGLPKPTQQVEMNEKMREFFKHFTVEAISKTLSSDPYHINSRRLGYYLYVDMPTTEEIDAAVEALDGTVGPWGHRLEVRRARGGTNWPDERARWIQQNEDRYE